MGKYIDAEKLKAEIEARKKVHFEDYHIKKSGNPADYGAANALTQLLPVIDSLQQEQSEVDLEEEVKKYFQGLWPGIETAEQCNTDMHFTPLAILRMVEYFYELGLNARKEE